MKCMPWYSAQEEAFLNSAILALFLLLSIAMKAIILLSALPFLSLVSNELLR